jgi:hypothetical protein
MMDKSMDADAWFRKYVEMKAERDRMRSILVRMKKEVEKALKEMEED